MRAIVTGVFGLGLVVALFCAGAPVQYVAAELQAGEPQEPTCEFDLRELEPQSVVTVPV